MVLVDGERILQWLIGQHLAALRIPQRLADRINRGRAHWADRIVASGERPGGPLDAGDFQARRFGCQAQRRR